MALPSNLWVEEGKGNLKGLTSAFVILCILYQAGVIIYNIFFHPLRNFPGPILHRASSIPWAVKQLCGVQAFHTHKLHERYGKVVRIGPNHLSFTDPCAWQDIYGHHGGSKPELEKAWPFVRTARKITNSILSAEKEEHQRLRRALSHGFSETSMREQEPTIVKYVDLLLHRLHERVQSGSKSQNIEAWYNWTTFDVIGDLVFGNSFGCLDSMQDHPWIAFSIKAVKSSSILIALGYVGLGTAIPVVVALGSFALKQIHRYTGEIISKRLKMQRNDDLFEGLIKRRHEWNLSVAQLAANATILVLAGSETTATALSGATYLLLSHPDILEKLKTEVRSSFNSKDEINLRSASKLTYMLAVLNESLRLYPPVTSGLTFVEVQHWSVNRSRDNWVDPMEFRPERFLQDTNNFRAVENKIEALQAFSVGPRNCLGRNLAFAEMRLVLARIIYEFDIQLGADSDTWIDRQKSYPLWDRIPLHVVLTPVWYQSS